MKPEPSLLRRSLHGPSHRWWALVAVEFGNFVVYMDGFIVTLALPAMARQFGVGLSTLKWVIVAYMLSVTITLLPAGRMADLWGRRRIVAVGMGGLAISSLMCFLATSFPVLLFWRVLQGIGGGLVLANVMAEITSVFPLRERRTAMAVNASVLALAQVTGLVLGGLVIGTYGWPSLFLIILAISLAGLDLCLLVLEPSSAAGGGPPFDAVGALLWSATVAAPFLLIEHLSGAWPWPLGLALAAAALLLLVGFLAVERRTAQPLLRLSLLRSRAFSCGSFAAAFYFVAAVSAYFLLPLYAQFVLGLTPLRAGLLLVPLSVMLVITSLSVTFLGGRFGARSLSTLGLLAVSGALLLLSGLQAGASEVQIVPPLLLLGAGGGLFQPPNNSATLNPVPAQNLSVGNGFLSTSRNFGQALGASLAGSILSIGLGSGGAQVLAGRPGSVVTGTPLIHYMTAQHHAFQLAAALGLVGAVVSLLRGRESPQRNSATLSPPPASGGNPAGCRR